MGPVGLVISKRTFTFPVGAFAQLYWPPSIGAEAGLSPGFASARANDMNALASAGRSLPPMVTLPWTWATPDEPPQPVQIANHGASVRRYAARTTGDLAKPQRLLETLKITVQ